MWVLTNDDYHAKPRPAEAERFDQSRTVVLLEEQSRADLLKHRAGRSCVRYDGAAPESVCQRR